MLHGPLSVKFPNIYVPLQSFRCQRSDVKEVPYWVPKNVERHYKRFRRFCDLANGTEQPSDVMFRRNLLYPHSLQKCLSGNKVHVFIFIVSRVRLSGPAERVVTPYSPATTHHSKRHHMPELVTGLIFQHWEKPWKSSLLSDVPRHS
jgi:hypothetical protein